MWLVNVGLIIAAILVLIPVVMAGKLLFATISSGIELRRAESRRVSVAIAGLGTFTTTDNCVWFGEVRALQISIMSPGTPPTSAQVAQLLSTLNEMHSLMNRARAFLANHEDMSWLEGGAAGFEPYGIDFESGSDFALESTHASDPDGVYRVEFCNGVAVSSGRDD